MADKERKIKITGDADGMQTSINELKTSTVKAFDTMQTEADKSTKGIDSAFRKLGIKQEKNLKKSTADARKAYATIKKDGRSSAADIARAHSAMTATIKANNAALRTSTSRVNKVMAVLKSRVVAIGAGVGVVALFKAMTKAALGNEIQVNRLITQIENMGISYDDVSDKIQKAITLTSKYADVQSGDVSEVLKNLVFVTGDLDLSLKNLNLVYDLAVQKGISLEASTDLIGKALSGNITTLGRYFIEFKNVNEALGKNSTNAQKAAFANAVLDEKVAGSIGNLSRNETNVRKLTNSWSSFIQFAGEIIIPVLNKVFKGIVFLTGAWLRQQKITLTAAKAWAIISDKIGITDDAVGRVDKAFESLNTKIDSMDKILESLNGTQGKFNQQNKRSVQTGDQVAAAIKKQNEELAKQAKLKKTSIDLEQEANDVFVKAGKTNIDQLKKVNKLSSDAVKKQKELVKQLSGEVNSAQDFLDEILQTQQDIARSQAVGERAGTPAARIELGFTAEDIRAAEQLIKSGDEEKARALLATAAATAAEISKSVDVSRSVRRDADETISRIVELSQGMVNTSIKAQEAATEALKIKEGIEASNMAAVTFAQEGLQLALDKAIELKKKLSEDTTATHTQKIVTEGGGVPGLRKGGQIPGGYGGGDRIHLLGEPGEVMMRKEVVKEMGMATALKINKFGLRKVLDALPKFQKGGEIKKGGSDVNVNLNLGQNRFPMQAPTSTATGLVDEINKINILNGRRSKRY
jgi:hypothetical protein